MFKIRKKHLNIKFYNIIVSHCLWIVPPNMHVDDEDALDAVESPYKTMMLGLLSRSKNQEAQSWVSRMELVRKFNFIKRSSLLYVCNLPPIGAYIDQYTLSVVERVIGDEKTHLERPYLYAAGFNETDKPLALAEFMGIINKLFMSITVTHEYFKKYNPILELFDISFDQRLGRTYFTERTDPTNVSFLYVSILEQP